MTGHLPSQTVKANYRAGLQLVAERTLVALAGLSLLALLSVVLDCLLAV